MKILLQYDKNTGELKDKNGDLIATWHGAAGFKKRTSGKIVLELIKQGVSSDEIIKLKNNKLL